MRNAYTCYSAIKFSSFSEKCSAAANSLFKWFQEGADHESEYQLSEEPLDLAAAYCDCPSPKNAPLRVIFWEPMACPGKCAMMTNSNCGLFGTVGYFAESVPYECIFVSMCKPKVVNGFRIGQSYQFHYYKDFGRTTRIVGLGQDNTRWEFTNYGPLQDFEEPASYQQKRRTDRISRDLITLYMQRLGYPISADEFWMSQNPMFVLRYRGMHR